MTPTRKGKRRIVTLKQVAELAGVHASTVSRALNPSTRSMVMPAVVERVVKAANNLGYRPDPVAASLRTGRSALVGILVPDIANTVFAPILSGASERLSAQGYSVILADVGNDESKQIDLVTGLMARRVDGLILATVSRDDPLVAYCVEQDLPAVLVNRAETQSRLSSVVSDDTLGMKMAVDHLVELGHRRIAHLAGPARHSTGFLRRRGFTAAMTANGLDADAAPCENADAFARGAGAAAMRQLLDTSPDITAVVAANDLLALGAYDALRERGISCPGDISVIGHNDMPLVDMVEPALTTIRISHREMGRQSADLLQQAIEQHDVPVRTIVLPPQLVVRRSTAAPRMRG
ncbi:LacI family DNA-binding transcriptional regulator [Bradyrhizobium sp. U87765 SZCCT0131]|uniref:LacI family DNA-binding transcriptional regulator n=1 Tax=unclassified Bradyrhizobium TaxID=2631580 RepID=UPI001BAB971C|nr:MULTISPECIES: LacI family DNA-binding transcriptional regulator [unclassified Bradyrhizobium]MBR1217438.1 LacI family DNA-binding transcriptional regulator [Bradyrhizobium sp. U87765 SZCCT0131]MBR1264965.1 LacI family DNA-binding transcriptional regulator [Bradyrhizobium sp. U87765 SZCCT0134]MBR1304947.1 LacI family DNA-binding transcriptional regulator [Bradyrhizobium sp. U87765 SZCCT0110]MBR1320733.1 LacI family DNA-binding transcriptional regulator [Bradyrhizobium sp. U87765 SZCCT0109]MB